MTVNLEVANKREEILNKALYDAWDKYTKALGQGSLVEVEATYSKFASAVVADLIQIPEVLDTEEPS